MIRFLMIARVLYDKGYSEYVEAARIIKSKHSEAEFLLLGSIDDAYPNHVPKNIVDHDVEKGTINYLGYISEVGSIIRTVDCIVLPSYHEGMSRVLMEGLAMSKPIITTDIPGCKETVDDGINGFLCKPRDVDSLVEALEKFLSLSNKERLLLGRAGRNKAEKQFDINKVIEIYHSLTDI